MKLSVIMACYNEVNTLEAAIDAIREVALDKEIIVVDDASTDGTRELVKNRLEGKKVDRVIYHNVNMGKGASIRDGLKEVAGDCVIFQDADMECDPQDYLRLIKPIEKGKADVVYGSRFLMREDARRVFYFRHYLGNRILTILSNLFTNLNLSDMETCYKMFRREIIEKINITENRFGLEPEITAKLAKLGCRIYEVGISYYGRSIKEGKKIGLKDGIRAVYCIVKFGILHFFHRK